MTLLKCALKCTVVSDCSLAYIKANFTTNNTDIITKNWANGIFFTVPWNKIMLHCNSSLFSCKNTAQWISNRKQQLWFWLIFATERA